ncbi:MAG: hypothetical protein QOF76_446, partial [Solirubrobacteraceae bacterium]|nr:hypothetical protein [Solirubrobacteraceae bacterium]
MLEDLNLMAVSAGSAAETTPAVAARIQALATDLARQTAAIAAVITERVLVIEPRLAEPGDPIARESAEHSTLDNVGAILSMFAYGIPLSSIQPPIGALELFEGAAENDDGLNVVLRGYRLGLAELWQIWAAHVKSQIDDVDELHAVMTGSTSHMHSYIDAMSEQLIERWADTRRRRRMGFDVAPEGLISKALSGADDGSGLRRL